ncbi:uncharacterized protein DUF998 [Tamaricihabitans halophyticus]|uniref:Uncharacterized protein DUF998 n=1 Tax=Tamaricihabitans halophyticus TaxID=1262583 RepID=A0A4R2PZP6_9PSEU|nr:DUF998 domain-containing protein [Tamaricihabitans halophyticus]TCP41637.1 uncharacterized protein DUF998 [Tamaricihabitans halophyticus]
MDVANIALAPSRTRLVAPNPHDGAIGTTGGALGFGGLGIAVLLMTYLHVVASGLINPLDRTMSDYVHVPGSGWAFGASVLAIAVATIGTGIGLARVGLLGSRLLRLALVLTIVGALLAGTFPTNASGPLTMAAEIHRYSAGVVFFCVPIAAALTGIALRGSRYDTARRWLFVGAAISAGALVLFLGSHFGSLPEGFQALRGLFQRLLLAIELGVLAMLTYLPAHMARRTRC